VAEREYRLTPRAERDLEEIWRYTEEQWSAEQAEKYVIGLIDTMEALAHNPTRGRSAEDIRPGYRRQSVGSHAVFYKTATYGILVTRILHLRMNFESHFDLD
jgi:toxin ParE1/3/4